MKKFIQLLQNLLTSIIWFGEEKFRMAGTTGSYEYAVYFVTMRGRLGVRDLGGGMFRIRIEPVRWFGRNLGNVLTRENGWKQPGDDGQDRYSIVVSSGPARRTALENAVGALTDGASSIQFGEYDQSDVADEISIICLVLCDTDTFFGPTDEIEEEAAAL